MLPVRPVIPPRCYPPDIEPAAEEVVVVTTVVDVGGVVVVVSVVPVGWVVVVGQGIVEGDGGAVVGVDGDSHVLVVVDVSA